MKLVYIAGPYRADTPYEIERNIRRAEDLGLEVARNGAVPVIPHTMYRFFQDSLPDDFWLDGTMEILRRCDAILMGPQWEESAGSNSEFKEAEKLGLAIFYWQEDVMHASKKWFQFLGVDPKYST